jgi:acyl-CoA thioester hydrolase
MADRIESCDIEIRVRYEEVDRMGALHHSRFWIYFEMGRTELLRLQGACYAECEQRGVFFVVAKAAIKYLAPARYDELLVLTTKVAKTGMARIEHTYELHRKEDSQLLATGETTLACVDRDGKLMGIPDWVSGKLAST